MIAEFAADGGQQLHADTDAQERRAVLQHFFAQHLHHARHGGKPAHAVGKGAHARQHDAFRVAHNFRIGGDDDLMPGVGGGARQRLRRRGEIAGAIIDESDLHDAEV